MEENEFKKLFEQGEYSIGIEIKLLDEEIASSLKKQLLASTLRPFIIKNPKLEALSWQEINRNLYATLRAEKRIILIILTLFLCIASFSITSTLYINMLNKKQTVAILQSMGLSKKNIFLLFITYGLILAITGILIGALVGYYLTTHINQLAAIIYQLFGFELFPLDNFFIKTIPIKILFSDFAYMAGLTFFFTFCAMVYPAYLATNGSIINNIRFKE